MDTYRLSNTISFDYDIHILENLLNDYKLERDINESILLYSNEATIEDISLVHEGFKEKTKTVFAKLLENIKNLWSRFVEVMSGLLSKDGDYLKRYKKVILENQMRGDNVYLMYDHSKGMKFIESAQIPAFNFNAMSDDLVSEDAFISRYFKAYTPNGEDSFGDNVKRLFRGSNVEVKIKSSSMDIKEMYKYCSEFDNNIKGIEKDMSEIEKAGNEAITIIDRMESTNEAFAYSFLTESVLQEIEKVEDGNSKPELTNVKGDRGDPTNIKSNTENKTADIDKVKLYIKVCYSFLGAKMSVMQEAYKAYMYIIKDHVKEHVGSDTASGVVEDDKKQDTSKPKGDEPELKKNFFSSVKDKIKNKKS